MYNNKIVIVRGGGDIATGVISALWSAGYKVVVTETPTPSAIRRHVALSEAVYDGKATLEGIECILCSSAEELDKVWNEDKIPMLTDPDCTVINYVKPFALVDAILAKKNMGTTMDMAPITVALGPGFCAGKDVNIVIETMRGHNLGKLIESGYALPNTKTPGVIAGEGEQRVIHSPAEGIIKNINKIADTVKQGEPIAEIITANGEKIPVKATINGLLRGLIRDGYYVTEGFKIADIDPRVSEYNNCFTVSDKARCLGGAVLQALGRMEFKKS